MLAPPRAPRPDRARAAHVACSVPACTAICALVAWSDVTNLQRDPAVGRAAHRELPRRGEELGAAAAPASSRSICIVDYHAITGAYEPDGSSRAARARWRSRCSPPASTRRNATLFVQSMVPEHTELAWIFNTVTPLGELERQTQFKEKAQRQESVTAGLLNYPVLQAADILLYRADLVPVGEDQVQHLELVARDRAAGGTREFGERRSFPSRSRCSRRRAASWDSTARRRCPSRSATPSACSRSQDEIWAKLRPAVTDPARVRQDRSGHARGVQHLPPAQGVQRRARPWSTWRRSAAPRGGGASTARRCWHEGMMRELTPIRERATRARGAAPSA